jgi:hypothetical protein
MPNAPVPDSERQFLILIQYAGALCLGIMFGFFGSIESINPQIVFSLNWKVWVGLFGGGLFSWWALGRIFASAEAADSEKTGDRRPLFWMLVFCFVVAGLTLAGFVWSLRETSESRIRDVIIGNAIAIWVLGFACVLVWNTVRFFEENSAEAEKQFNREHNIPDEPKG